MSFHGRILTCLQATELVDKLSMQPAIPQKSPIVEKARPGTYWWCSCGKSESQPFCDGSHAGTQFSPVEVVIEAEKDVA